jgi:serine protease AprX
MRIAAVGSVLIALLPFPGNSNAGLALSAPASNAAWARAVVERLPVATTVNDRDGNKLFDELDTAYTQVGDRERLPVIVSFRYDISTADGIAAVRQIARNGVVEERFTLIPAYAGRLSHSEAIAVGQLEEIRQIELDSPGHAELDTATKFMGADAVVDQLGFSGSLDKKLGVITGKDVGIAVFDSGIDGTHQEFAGDKISHSIDIATEAEVPPIDTNGHGTHVANIAAGWGKEPDYRGVAPGAALINIMITTGTVESNAIKGFEWIVKHKAKHNIRVATISYGFGTATDGTTALERAVDKTWAAGIVCFKSNGNSGPGAATVTVPAAARGILAIGSLLDPAGQNSGILGVDYGFRLSPYSSRGPTSDGRIKPDLSAPGESIMAAAAGSTNRYVAFSGTSMASPFAAGTAALMISANPKMKPDEVRNVLYKTAADWGAKGPDSDYGHGRIRVLDAVTETLRRAGKRVAKAKAPEVPRHEVVEGTVPASGVVDEMFTVANTQYPISITVIVGGKNFSVQAWGPGDVPFSPPSVDLAVDHVDQALTEFERQADFSFIPTETGDFGIRIIAQPSVPFVIDMSHSTARAPKES